MSCIVEILNEKIIENRDSKGKVIYSFEKH